MHLEGDLLPDVVRARRQPDLAWPRCEEEVDADNGHEMGVAEGVGHEQERDGRASEERPEPSGAEDVGNEEKCDGVPVEE